MAVQRMFGLSGSGIDVDSMVKQLMQAKRLQYANLYQNRTWLEWKKQAYNDMDSNVTTFQSALTSYKLSSSLSIKAVDTTDTTVATATANADAANISHNITVSQLADGVQMTSTGNITTGAAKDTIANQFGLAVGTFDITLTNGGASKTITVDTSQSIYTFINQINTAGINLQANYDTTLDRFFINTTNTGATSGISFQGSSTDGFNFLTQSLKLPVINQIGTAGLTSDAVTGVGDPSATLSAAFGMSGTFHLKIANGTSNADILVDTSVDSLNSVISKINTAGVNANANYDAGSDKFSLAAASGTLDLSASDPAAFDLLENKLKLSEKGQDAQFNLDGVNLTETANTFTISGVTYNLKGAGTTAVTVNTDLDKTVTSIQGFVDAYNKLLDSLNEKIDERRDYDYPPLTDDQKSSMKDADITSWETKAKTGLLQSDTILTSLVYGMRNAVADPISGQTGTYTSAASIGLTTGSYQEGGHLYLDPNKLRAALQADPSAVQKIFGTNGNESDSQNGIAYRLSTLVDNANSQLLDEAGTADLMTDQSSLGRQIGDYNDTITSTESMLTDLETQYYNQFSQMETYIQQMNSQSAWLSQQFGSSG